MTENSQSLKVLGIIGFGRLGQYIIQNIIKNGEKLGLKLGFVWNRTKTPQLESMVDKSLILNQLSDFDKYVVDLIVEVSHPFIIYEFGAQFIKHSDLMIGSPSCLADRQLEAKLLNVSTEHSLFIPSGALWGGNDIRKMSERNTLKGLTVSMHFHPQSLKLDGQLKTLNDSIQDKPIILYKGPVRQVCSLAPNNVNTMAVAAIAGYTLGFDNTIGCLISDPNLTDYHKIEIEVIGPENIDKNCTFKVNTTRVSPTSGSSDVTSYATFASFWSSILSKVKANERSQVGICYSYHKNMTAESTSCFQGNYTKFNRIYCCIDNHFNRSLWTRVEYCCNIDEFADQYSTKLFLTLTLVVFSGLIFSVQTLFNINSIMMTFGTNQTNLKYIKTLADNQNDNKTVDKIKNNEENKNKISTNSKNSGNRNFDAKPKEQE